jgi:hypothetical protein
LPHDNIKCIVPRGKKPAERLDNGDADENDPEEADEETLGDDVTEYMFEEFRTGLAAIKQKTKVEKKVIASLNAFANADAMRAHFSPPYI